MTPIKETSSQFSGCITDSIQKIDSRSKPAPLLNNSQSSQQVTQEIEKDSTVNNVGDDNIPPVTITTSKNKELLVRDENTIKLYKPLFTTIVLKRMKKMV